MEITREDGTKVLPGEVFNALVARRNSAKLTAGAKSDRVPRHLRSFI